MDSITTVILGSICGLKNVRQIYQWASADKISELLKEQFRIYRIPCYYWLLSLLKIIKPEFLNKCFAKCKG
ncbi:MAG: transposase family protein [Ruminococcus sp.]|nr:transposase family protein [Ruminococcus sp.]